ncbi:hypothetical protein GLV98_07865 [Halobacillus litoralis]|uniref:Uncharacterized protein n=1 Tax=Halobacillus litoralis TaxID=45668 RepID=A0A845E0Y3_9BACI|nr:hypothetical protein [Halobacillus litoralis]MYL49397.1 hypothetical protein [Halobacillus litoralis]
MKNKTIFKREATFKNQINFPIPPIPLKTEESIRLDGVVHQYSQLSLKHGWSLLCSNNDVVANHYERGDEEEFMLSIAGDESPLSYVQAAMCYHHLLEYSHRRTDVISQAIIDDDYVRQLDLLRKWKLKKVNRSFNPLFFYDSFMHPAVIFFTYHVEGLEVIQKHVHRFDVGGSYKLRTLRRTWATVS